MANVSETEYPKLNVEFKDYNSFIANSLMLKKEKEIDKDIEELVIEVQMKMNKTGGFYSELIKNCDLQTKDNLYLISSECDFAIQFFKSNDLKVNFIINEKLEHYGIPLQEFLNKICLIAFNLHLSWEGDNMNSRITDAFISSLSHPLFTQCFSKMLQIFRKINRFELSQKAFENISELILICLTKCTVFYQVNVPLELINISGTYYTKVSYGLDNEKMRRHSEINLPLKKVYLLQGIKKHNIFKNFKFWESSLLNLVNQSKEEFDFHDKRQSIEISLINENYKSKISKTFMTIAIHMNDLGCNKEMVMRLFGIYFEKYQLGDKFLIELNTFLASNFNSEEENDTYIPLNRKESEKTNGGNFFRMSLPTNITGGKGLIKRAIGIFKKKNESEE